MRRYRKFITRGIREPLENVPFHGKAPIKRLSMAGRNLVPDSKMHIAVHLVNSAGRQIPKYSTLHRHNTDEINLIISESGKLTYRIQLDDETYRVSSPATVFIPRGVRHKAEVLSGKGVFVCIIKSSKYRSSK